MDCLPSVNSETDMALRTATQILSAVQTGISKYKATKVTMVGHSLGAAISLLDAVYLPLHIKGVSFQTVLYGLPRVRHTFSFFRPPQQNGLR